MNKSRISVLLLSLLMVGGITGCNDGTSYSSVLSSSTSDISSSSTSDISSSLTTSESSLPDWVEYTDRPEAKLQLDYEGRDFFTEGVGEVDLHLAIDGDTAHFIQSDGSKDTTIKGRFYGCDTPESTGDIQEWGRTASNFTKERLKEADKNGTIVIVSMNYDHYGTPSQDSNGRDLVLVYYNETVEHASKDQLKLLNLEIVEQGLSWAKNTSNIKALESVFYDAETQAREYKLNMFSGVPEEGWVPATEDNYGDVSLLDLKNEVAKQIEDRSYSNKYDNVRMRVNGTVVGYVDNTLYINAYIPNDPDDATKGGQYAGINIFTGMSKIPTKYTKMNTYLQIMAIGNDSENFGFQLTDADFPIASIDSLDSQVIYTPEENADTDQTMHVFTYTKDQLNEVATTRNLESLYGRIEVTDTLEVDRVYQSQDESAYTVYFKDSDFNLYVPFNYRPEGDTYWKTEEQWLNKKLKIKGVYAYHYTTSGNLTFQVIPNDSSDIIVVE
ncbi:MAG: thermonuclease family protein [Firmicutes bacterium]|uniref:Thermonuclease family protein n=1 Tax=Candidatus Scatoplasma merdavium TaxID=2840932 RepID=A0A9D9D968_9BACL|nr:thermonuclease family protein [Candidatus Scatoplasma merdavium]